jgi:hypothetical protein
MTPRIIGISGKMGTGKNYIAEKVIPKHLPHDVVPIYLAFADQIKVELYSGDTTATLTYDNLFNHKTAESRQLLQEYGTEVGRKQKKTKWVDALDMWITIFSARWNHPIMTPVFIITDVRFPNELEYIKQKGGVIIRVEAPERNHARLLTESGGDADAFATISTHRSETALDNCDPALFDEIIQNDPRDMPAPSYASISSQYNHLILDGR